MAVRNADGAALLCLLSGFTIHLAAQTPGTAETPPRVYSTSALIRLDGHLDEPVWLSADSITSIRQSDPDEGQPVTEHTVVRFLARPDGLYVGVWNYDREPRGIRRAQLRRDADFSSDDVFYLLLDPQLDRRSGYVFGVNPNGAMYDSEISKAGEENPDWDGVWDARASITEQGWCAELVIPWRTLRFRVGQSSWGMNLERDLRRTNQYALWRAWKRNQGLLFQEEEGELTGFEELRHTSHAELRPYLAAIGRMDARSFDSLGVDSVTQPGGTDLRAGADLRFGITPTLTADLTANTDFAQTEADQQVINLTRFPLFFPEKRPFFLEGSGIFDLGQPEHNLLFYSRRIGLAGDGSVVPLKMGGRIQGRIGHERVGLLAVRTGGDENAADIVGRVEHDVFSRGYVGVMGTAQQLGGEPTRLGGGFDFQIPTLPRGQNLNFAGYVAITRDSGGAKQGGSWRAFIDYPNDRVNAFLAVSGAEAGYDPALGFIVEKGVWRHTGGAEFFPRPRVLGIRRLSLKAIEWDVNHHLGGGLSHAFYEIRPLGADFESGDGFEIDLQRFEDAPQADFEIFPGSTIAAGYYGYNRAQLRFSSSVGRPVSLELVGSKGDFYDGSATDFSGKLQIRVAPHLNTGVEYSWQAVQRPVSSFVAQAARLRLDLAANPRLGATMFLQWDNESSRLSINAKLHWIPRPGSDAFLVWNSRWPTNLDHGIHWSHPEGGAVIGKFVYYFAL